MEITSTTGNLEHSRRTTSFTFSSTMSGRHSSLTQSQCKLLDSLIHPKDWSSVTTWYIGYRLVSNNHGILVERTFYVSRASVQNLRTGLGCLRTYTSSAEALPTDITTRVNVLILYRPRLLTYVWDKVLMKSFGLFHYWRFGRINVHKIVASYWQK